MGAGYAADLCNGNAYLLRRAGSLCCARLNLKSEIGFLSFVGKSRLRLADASGKFFA